MGNSLPNHSSFLFSVCSLSQFRKSNFYIRKQKLFPLYSFIFQSRNIISVSYLTTFTAKFLLFFILTFHFSYHIFLQIFCPNYKIWIGFDLIDLFSFGRTDQSSVEIYGIFRQIAVIDRDTVTAGFLNPIPSGNIQIFLIGICEFKNRLLFLLNDSQKFLRNLFFFQNSMFTFPDFFTFFLNSMKNFFFL